MATVARLARSGLTAAEIEQAVAILRERHPLAGKAGEGKAAAGATAAACASREHLEAMAKARQLDTVRSVVGKLHVLVLLVFLGIGVLLYDVLSSGRYAKLLFEHTLMSSAGTTLYFVTLFALLAFRRDVPLNVVVLLHTTFVTGILGGFLACGSIKADRLDLFLNNTPS